MIVKDVLEHEEASEYGSIYDDDDASDEEGYSGSGEAYVSTGVTEVGTKEVEEVNQDVNSPSLFSYMFKPPYLITQGSK